MFMRFILKGLIIFIIFSLVTGSVLDYVYANVTGACSCCDSKCSGTSGAKSCHDTAKACLCRYSAPLQVYLLKNEVLPKPELCGYLAHNLQFFYTYLSNEDIFHPPKINLF